MRKEYRTSKYTLADPRTEIWEGVITIDLRYVAAAEPWDCQDDPRFTMVTLMSGRTIPVRDEYPRFLRDWHSVKP